MTVVGTGLLSKQGTTGSNKNWNYRVTHEMPPKNRAPLHANFNYRLKLLVAFSFRNFFVKEAKGTYSFTC